MAQQDGTADPGYPQPPPQQNPHPGFTQDTTNRVIGALSEPRSFLLFIFATMGLVEYVSYIKTQMLVTTMISVLAGSTAAISREQDFNRDMMSGLLRILEQGIERGQGRLEEHQGQQAPPQPSDATAPGTR